MSRKQHKKGGSQAAGIKIARDLRSLKEDPIEGVFCDLAGENLFEWNIWFEGPESSPYQGGIFQARMRFPPDYPMAPPGLEVISEFWHPNVYPDGRVCISILHPPGNDPYSDELPEERWLPTQTVSTIMLSFQSMLSDPNINSPANIDASVQWRDQRQDYIKKTKTLVEKANKRVPSHIRIPHPDSNADERKVMVEKFKKQQEVPAFHIHDDHSGSEGSLGGLESEEEEEKKESESEGEEDIAIVDCPVCNISMVKQGLSLQCTECPIRKKKDQFLCGRHCYTLTCGEVLPTGTCTLPLTKEGNWKCSGNTHKDDPEGEENFLALAF